MLADRNLTRVSTINTDGVPLQYVDIFIMEDEPERQA
jgi:hypothetical protein